MDDYCESPESSNAFWFKPTDVDSDTDSVAISPSIANVFEAEDIIFANMDASTEIRFCEPSSITSSADSTENRTSTQSLASSATKLQRQQTKMLLVSLIETFCRIYGDSPDANRKVFFLICQTLKSLGIIDTEFINEMASVRSTFQRTFQKLFYAAVQTVQNESLIDQNHRLLLPEPSSTPDSTYKANARRREEGGGMTTMSTTTSIDSRERSYSSLSSMSSTSQMTRHAFFDLSIQHSRYCDDFTELTLLGRGGFALAYRARNNLDGIDYAVKKVRLGPDLNQGGSTSYKKIFREIKHLARLEHPNVIRYYSSWLEYDSGVDSAGQFLENDTFVAGWTLYIQMQLCPTTLYDYIEARNQDFGAVDSGRNLSLFSQILQGTLYIHKQGLIHRDLKPSNIFLTLPPEKNASNLVSTNGMIWEACIPKIGDFGLAAALMDEDAAEMKFAQLKNINAVRPETATVSPKLPGTPVQINDKRKNTPITARKLTPQPRAHTIGIGTQTYASPEQLRYSGKPYDEKVDVYSLGIIFFELYQPFTTSMERADAIRNLKQFTMLPDAFVERHPKESAIILWMMDHEPERRPTVQQLLDYGLFSPSSEDLLEILASRLKEKSDELDTEKKKVESLKLNIQRLEQERLLEREEMQQKLDMLKLESISNK
ncbi:kinase-like protein [Hesseltinella vesiculosa]|uniref:non-specific serine/threonine protein kinase n=1 Tax=Hesseltinella vesiculosa TaxID=101127 RepID=A0A1X2GA42_9FUNG|nr:kinase-like protein [Hesseltinella vesiculosa]